jgi:hypothetical protein
MKKASSAVTELNSLLRSGSLRAKDKEATEILAQISDLIARLKNLA